MHNLRVTKQLLFDLLLERIGELPEPGAFGWSRLAEVLQKTRDEAALTGKIAVPDRTQIRLGRCRGEITFELFAEGIYRGV